VPDDVFGEEDGDDVSRAFAMQAAEVLQHRPDDLAVGRVEGDERDVLVNATPRPRELWAFFDHHGSTHFVGSGIEIRSVSTRVPSTLLWS